MCVYIYICVYLCVYLCMCACTCTCVCVYVCMCKQSARTAVPAVPARVRRVRPCARAHVHTLRVRRSLQAGVRRSVSWPHVRRLACYEHGMGTRGSLSLALPRALRLQQRRGGSIRVYVCMTLPSILLSKKRRVPSFHFRLRASEAPAALPLRPPA